MAPRGNGARGRGPGTNQEIHRSAEELLRRTTRRVVRRSLVSGLPCHTFSTASPPFSASALIRARVGTAGCDDPPRMSHGGRTALAERDTGVHVTLFVSVTPTPPDVLTARPGGLTVAKLWQPPSGQSSEAFHTLVSTQIKDKTYG